MITKLAATFNFNPFQLAVRLELFPRGHDQRRRKLALRSNQHHLVHKTRTLDRLLDWLRRDVLAARRLEQLLLTIGDAQKSIFIERANIARLEPAVAREHRARFFRLVVVTAHHVWTTHFNLAVFRNANLDVRNHLANRSRTHIVDTASRDHWGSFRQPVTLHDRNSRAEINVRKILRQSRTTRHQQSHLAAKRALPLRKYELRSDRVFELERYRNRLMRKQELRVLTRHRDRQRHTHHANFSTLRG